MSILATPLFHRLALCTFGLLLLALSSGCGKDLPAQNFRLLTFGTYMDLELIGVDRQTAEAVRLSLIHISEPTRQLASSRMPSSA